MTTIQPARSNRRGFIAALAALLMVTSAGSAFADPYHGYGDGSRDRDNRQDRQERYLKEVRAGADSGRLSTGERKQMQKRMQRIEDYKRDAMRDGRLSNAERQQIRAMERQNRQMTLGAIRR